MPDLWLCQLGDTPSKHTPRSTGKAWSLQTSRQPTGAIWITHKKYTKIAPSSMSKNMATTKSWIWVGKSGVPKRAECLFCYEPATLDAAWKTTAGDERKDFICQSCHDEMDADVKRNAHLSSIKAA
jgi:hypothetical protein